jgi:hypothetical protein
VKLGSLRRPSGSKERWGPCPDCQVEGRLGITEQPRTIGGALRGSTPAARRRTPITLGCETCGGTGRVVQFLRNHFRTLPLPDSVRDAAHTAIPSQSARFRAAMKTNGRAIR